MHVYLLRHGIAEEGRPGMADADRALTAEGRQKLRHVMRLARDAEMEPTRIVSSPLKRALQTAAIARQALNFADEIDQWKALLPGSTPECVWDQLRAHRHENEILLVGHEPLFSQLSSYLLDSPQLRIDFKKGALMRIDFESLATKPRGILRWFLVAKLSLHRG